MGPGMKLTRFGAYPPTTPHDDAARSAVAPSDMGESFWFWCLGCDTHHSFRTKLAKDETGPVWSFNGDMERPTFQPSLLYRYHMEKHGKDFVCHLFLRDGQIQYLSDCTHAYAGRTIPLPSEP